MTYSSYLEATIQIQIGNSTSSSIIKLTVLNPIYSSLELDNTASLTPPAHTEQAASRYTLGNTTLDSSNTTTTRFTNIILSFNPTSRFSASHSFPTPISPSLFTNGGVTSRALNIRNVLLPILF